MIRMKCDWLKTFGGPKRCFRSLVSGILWILLLMPISAYGAETMLSLYKKALEQDPRFQSATFRRLAADETVKQAWSDYLPTVGVEGDYIYTYQDVKKSDNPVYIVNADDFDTVQVIAGLKQPLFSYTAIMGISKAGSQIKQADAELEIERQNLLLRVAERYLNALARQDALVYAQAELTAVERHRKLAQALYEARRVPITDRYDAEARMNKVSAEVEEARDRLADALEALKEICGPLENLQLASVSETMPLAQPVPPDVQTWIDKAQAKNLKIEFNKESVEVARKEIKRLKGGHLPTLDLLAHWNRRDAGGSVFGGGFDTAITDVSMRVSVPLFQGGYVSSKVREALRLYEAASKELIAERRSATRRARDAFSIIKSSILRAKNLQATVRAETASLEAKKEGYQHALFTSLEVLDAERALYMTKQDLAQARYDYLLSWLKLHEAAGDLAEKNLVRISEWLR